MKKNSRIVLLFIAVMCLVISASVIGCSCADKKPTVESSTDSGLINPDEKFTLNFVSDGTGSMDEIMAEQGTTVELPFCEYINVGFDFEGWMLDGKFYKEGDLYVVDGKDVVFQAVWQPRLEIKLSYETAIYNGTEQRPLIEVYFRNNLLADENYSVNYGDKNYVDAGKYNIEITGKNEYSNFNKTIEYEIKQKKIDIILKDLTTLYNEEFVCSEDDYVINGLLENDTIEILFETEYKKGDDAGDYIVNLKFNSNNYYAEDIYANLIVLPRKLQVSINDQNITVEESMLKDESQYQLAGEVVVGDEVSVDLINDYNPDIQYSGQFNIEAVLTGKDKNNYTLEIVKMGVLTVNDIYSLQIKDEYVELIMGLDYHGTDLSLTEYTIIPEVQETGEFAVEYKPSLNNIKVEGNKVTAIGEGVSEVTAMVNGRVYDKIKFVVKDYSSYKKIGTPEEFIAMDPNNHAACYDNFVLVSDIDFGGRVVELFKYDGTSQSNWKSTTMFSGILDGNGHVVSNVSFDGKRSVNGIISVLGVGGVVKDISFKNIDIQTGHNGAIISQNLGGTIENVYAEVKVSSVTGGGGYNTTGTLVARNENNATVKNCVVKVISVGDNFTNFGLFAGINAYTNSKLQNCYLIVEDAKNYNAIFKPSTDANFNDVQVFKTSEDFIKFVNTEKTLNRGIWNIDGTNVELTTDKRVFILSGATSESANKISIGTKFNINDFIFSTCSNIQVKADNPESATIDENVNITFKTAGQHKIIVTLENTEYYVYFNAENLEISMTNNINDIFVSKEIKTSALVNNQVPTEEILWSTNSPDALNIVQTGNEVTLSGKQGKLNVELYAEYKGIKKIFYVDVYNAVATKEDFINVFNKNTTGIYKMTADIDFEGAEITHIGANKYVFKGIFDGGGFAVKNVKTVKKLNFWDPEDNSCLIYELNGNDTVLRNISFINFTMQHSRGGIVKILRNGATIENIYVEMNHMGGQRRAEGNGWENGCPGGLVQQVLWGGNKGETIQNVIMKVKLLEGTETKYLARTGFIVGCSQNAGLRVKNCHVALEDFSGNYPECVNTDPNILGRFKDGLKLIGNLYVKNNVVEHQNLLVDSSIAYTLKEQTYKGIWDKNTWEVDENNLPIISADTDKPTMKKN